MLLNKNTNKKETNMPDSNHKPIPFKELDKYFKARNALKDVPIAVQRRFHIVANQQPRVKTRVERIDRGDGQSDWEVIVEIEESAWEIAHSRVL
jgi:hypothetical protein